MKNFNVYGMSCAACQARVEKAVSKVNGVESCSVSLLTNSMSIEGSASDKDIIQAVEKAGYKASLKNDSVAQNSNTDETTALKKRLILSVCFLIPLMLFAMVLPKGTINSVVQLTLSFVIICINRKFYISGFKGVIHLSPNMDTLVSLGSVSSFIWSIYVLISGGSSLYFDSAAMILTLITVGKLLESISKGKTTNALKKLISLVPTNASIKPGDEFEVKPGESICADGTIISGSASINESILTGESLPVDKAEGDSVSAGTINLSGHIVCKATKVGNDTTLSQIIKLVSESASSKAPIAKIADKVSGIFVPVVVTISILTLIIWSLLGRSFDFALTRAVSVLVISCPCALGLATPVAIMVGNGVGAKNGILFKTAEALEETGKIQIVAFDKTGTITKGEPEVTKIIPINCKEDELLQVAYSVELKSEHPLAKAIVKEAQKLRIEALKVSDFIAFPGNGLGAKVEGKAICAGSVNYISKTTKLSTDILNRTNELSKDGNTPVLFSIDGQIMGIIAITDTIKEDSKQAVEELKNMGIQVVMLTGDNRNTAMSIGSEAGIENIISSVLPNEKDRVIKLLKQHGKVAMVGDGINDAPALTSADIGIAIGAGTDIAIDSANIVLVNSKISDVVKLIKLSRATLKNIKENLFWAFFYNVFGIPLAAGCFFSLFGWELNPMFGAAAMSLSSFCVISNALRLNLVNLNSSKKILENKKRITNTDFSKVINGINSALETKNMTKTLKIDGMMCCHCESHVKDALEAIDGVEKATASHVDGNAIVTLKKDVSDSVLKEAVEKQGYSVLNIK